jgi:hypothetical protein
MFATQRAALDAASDLSKETLSVLLQKLNTRYEARHGPDPPLRCGSKPVKIRRIGCDDWQRFEGVTAASKVLPVDKDYLQKLVHGTGVDADYEIYFDDSPRNVVQLRRRDDAGEGEWRVFSSRPEAVAEFPELTLDHLAGLLHESLAKFEARYVERVQKPILEVRKFGSDWVPFEGKNDALRKFPELPGSTLYALLEAGSLFEAKLGGAIQHGKPRPVDVRLKGASDASWHHFGSVAEATQVYLDLGKNFISDLLHGKSESITYEARYTPNSDEYVVKLRKKDDPNSDWVGFSSYTEVHAKYPLLKKYLAGLLHESASQFEARYIHDAQSNVADDEETRSIPVSLVLLASPDSSGLRPDAEPYGAAIEVRSLHDDDASWKWFKNRSAALSEFPELGGDALKVLLDGKNTRFEVQRSMGDSRRV